ncbi:type II toxin-antitoxin system RelE family toxin [Cryobacterium fucosi]|uniref:Type II toxin-antitoxin system RelE/ParE family toxin n=1 Tax=Cryobacterium fucosi TaxID=1259157 RepID=A0A4R9B2X4_9MICO|nr:type II toxin-antitoxin system RelE/ParE family toxin [Cryobacterium fucosi]TFD74494.1 type II toxin-antitoxin system RelE/ParE family toxin [Cryobacterium fucosi]
MTETYEVTFSASARRSLTEVLPKSVAVAAFEFIMGAVRADPKRVGKQLKAPLFPLYSARRGEYRVVYRVLDRILVIEIVTIAHRRDANRS